MGKGKRFSLTCKTNPNPILIITPGLKSILLTPLPFCVAISTFLRKAFTILVSTVSHI